MNKDNNNNTSFNALINNSILATKRISCTDIAFIPRNKRPYKSRRKSSNYMEIENRFQQGEKHEKT